MGANSYVMAPPRRGVWARIRKRFRPPRRLSFIIASGILSEMTLRDLKVERRPPPRIFASEPFLMEVVIKNAKAHRASYSIEVEDLIAKSPIDKRC